MIALLFILAGFYTVETPPADTDSAIALLARLMTEAEPAGLGMFFAEIGLEASPDEVHLWGPGDFHQLITDFTGAAYDSSCGDSLLPRLEELPLHLLQDNPSEATEHE